MQILLKFTRKIADRISYRRLFVLRRLNCSTTSYFANLGDTLIDNRIARKTFRDLEVQLRGLDSTAWSFLKEEAAPYLAARDEQRGWTQLFNILNQAHAYNYLAGLGCTHVRFIPFSTLSGQQTPDLEATLQLKRVLCEVKTINVSKEEADARQNYSVRSIVTSLDNGFFNKLRLDCERAARQMDAYRGRNDVKRIVYLVINYDDILHEYADNYSMQIEKYIADNPFENLDIVVDSKPAYYYATP